MRANLWQELGDAMIRNLLGWWLKPRVLGMMLAKLLLSVASPLAGQPNDALAVAAPRQIERRQPAINLSPIFLMGYVAGARLSTRNELQGGIAFRDFRSHDLGLIGIDTPQRPMLLHIEPQTQTFLVPGTCSEKPYLPVCRGDLRLRGQKEMDRAQARVRSC